MTLGMENITIKPFLRWIGGKRQILDSLRTYLPKNINTLRYIEPFLGAGSLFFDLRPSNAIVSDINRDLVLCYKQLKKKPELIYSYLKFYERNDSEKTFYRVRKQYNECNNYSAAQAARFIYLNKTCFNGIYRVNKNGFFNVPYGNRKCLGLPSKEDIIRISKLLKGAKIYQKDYAFILKKVQKGDFVYLDPPYPPLNGTSFFTHYTIDRFSMENQNQLCEKINEIDSRGAIFMLSNADTDSVRKSYRKFNINYVPVIRYVTCKKRKHTVKEVIITNY